VITNRGTTLGGLTSEIVPQGRAEERRVVTNRAVYLAISIDCEGHKQVLGLWIRATVGESAWLWVLSELKARGVADVCIVCCDSPACPTRSA
jgi:transposase-like protein